MNKLTENMFYRDQDSFLNLLEAFATKILPQKKMNVAHYTLLESFKYSDELSKIAFDYKSQLGSDFIDEFTSYFSNCLNFDCPGVLYNVHPNVNIYSLAASLFSSLANVNFCMDIPGGKLILLEKAVVNYLNTLVGWDENRASGVFTFGGKGTNIYALKIAIDKVNPESRHFGVSDNLYVISNDLGHPCHIEVCNWLGIGENKCIRLNTNNNGVVEIEDFKLAFIDLINKGKKLALIVLNAMSTNNHSFDDIKGIAQARDEIVNNYHLDYTPHIHVDSVLGWVYLIISRYDFCNNPLNIESNVCHILQSKVKKVTDIKYADSYSADFHKTGYCSFASSVFLTKQKETLFSIEKEYSENEDMIFSEYAPYDFTLESSRSSQGPVAAFTVLKTMGVEGFVELLAQQTLAFILLKNLFHEYSNSIVCNYDEDSNLIFLILKPEKYVNTVIDEDTPLNIANEFQAFNLGFYQYIIKKSMHEEVNLFFSCSRSYKYFGKSYGCLKLYSYNSNFDSSQASSLFQRIVFFYEEYLLYENMELKFKHFDYDKLKGK